MSGSVCFHDQVDIGKGANEYGLYCIDINKFIDYIFDFKFNYVLLSKKMIFLSQYSEKKLGKLNILLLVK
jgi:hypothetical protein